MRNLSEYFDLYNYLFEMIDKNSVDQVIEFLKNYSRKIYIIGNGGSMALAEHFSQDLSKKCGIRAIALNSPVNLTAYSNDIGYDSVFSEQIEVYGEEGDCLIMFSSSGNSTNICEALAYAKYKKMNTISFTGFDGGVIKDYSDLNIHIPWNDYGVTESLHDIICHYIIDSLFEKFTLDKIHTL